MAQNESSSRGPAWVATIWPLVTGLAVGFLVGREIGGHGRRRGRRDRRGRRQRQGAGRHEDAGQGLQVRERVPGRAGPRQPTWRRSRRSASTDLTTAQKVTVLQALNERDCECGCGMGKIAGCLKKDPNCPRSPNLAQAGHRHGRSRARGSGEILAAIDDKQKPAGGSAPSAARRRAGGSKKVVPFAHDLRRGAEGDQGDDRRVQRLSVPVLQALRADGQGRARQVRQGRGAGLDEPAAAVPRPRDGRRDGVPGRRAPGRDKAWKLHDKMYENNTALTRADIEKYAGEVGLNVGKFKKDWDDPKIKDEVDRGPEGRRPRSGANGTPTFFINGRELVGAQPAVAFEKIIDDEIKKADELIKKGTPLKDVYKKRIEAAALAPRRRRRRAPAAPEGKQDIKLGDAPVKGPASAPRSRWSRSATSSARSARAPCPTLKQIEDEYKGKVKHRLQAAAAAVPRQGAPGGRGGAGRQRAGQVLADARQAVRQPAGARSPVAGEVRRGAGPQHDQVQGGARLAASSRTRSTPTPRRAPPSAPPARRRSSSTARRSSARSPSTRSRPSSTPS